ncbi:MAG: hypothetical protein WAM11_06020 [Cyanobium sp.]
MPSLLRLWWLPAPRRRRRCCPQKLLASPAQAERPWPAATRAASLLLSVTLWLLPLLAGPLLATALLAGRPAAADAAPGLCVGPVCGDEFSRSAKHVFQLRLRLRDQRGHQERITVDCRDGHISPAMGPVERGYGAAVARRACRLVGGSPA